MADANTGAAGLVRVGVQEESPNAATNVSTVQYARPGRINQNSRKIHSAISHGYPTSHFWAKKNPC